MRFVGWVPDETGGYRGSMAILVKRNALLGTAYMAAIKPLRRLIIYPAIMRQIGRDWPKPTHELIDELPPLRPLASGRVQLGVHESTQLREAHGSVAPRLVEQSLRGCVEFPLEGALRGRGCHLHDDDMRVLP